MSDVFDDVEESLRRDALDRMVRRYGLALLIAAVAAFLGATGYVLYQNWRAGEARKVGERFFAVQELRANEDPGALAALDTFQKGAPAGYQSMADMERAAILQAQGDLAGAVAAFDRAATRTSNPIAKRTAELRAAYIVAETGDLAALEKRLSPIVEERGPFSYLARELIGLKAYEAGDLSRARTEFSFLQMAPEAPADLKQRVAAYQALLGPAETPSAGESE